MRSLWFKNLLLVLLAVSIYLPSVQYDFAYDDLLVIRENPLVTGPDSGLLKLLFSPTPPGDLYRPLMLLSFRIEYLLGKGDPAWLHTVNITLYALLCLLVHQLFLTLLPRKEAALWAAALFTIHPIHVEAVANIVGRAELLSALAGIGGFLLLEKEKRDAAITSTSLLSAVALLLATLSKESAFTFLLIYGALLLTTGRSLRLLAPHTLTVMLALFLRWSALGSSFLVTPESTAENPENPLLGLSFGERLLPALMIQGQYIKALLCPDLLLPDYSMLRSQLFSELWSASGIFSLLLVATFLMLLMKQESGRLRLCGLWFVLTFLLTSNILLPVGTIRADRLALVPGIGVIGLFVWQIFKVTPRHASTLVAVLGMAFMVRTVTLVSIWRNNSSLFQYLAINAPGNPKASYNLGIHLLTQEKRPDLAEPYLRETLELVPDHLYSMKALADIAVERNEYGRAAYWYTRILRSYPEELEIRKELERLNQAAESSGK